MSADEALELLALQPIGTIYITENLHGNQRETVCIKTSDQVWKELHGDDPNYWRATDIASEMSGKSPRWSLS